jgi:hypothetical protein
MKFNIEPMELKSKEAVADDILNKVIANFMNKIFTIFLLLSVGFTQAQQLNCTVTVNSETLEMRIYRFLNLGNVTE